MAFLDLKKQINKLLEAVKVDYVVEEGTSGSWTYRKWNSGTAECWYTWSSGSFAPSSAVGGFYGRVVGTFDFPTDFFIETPQAFFNLYSWGTGYFWGQVRATTATSFSLAVWRNDNAASAGAGSVYAIGRWK